MTTATAGEQSRHIVESFVGSHPSATTAKDDAGNDCIVIDDVVILASESTNGRRYTEACLQDAYDRGLYEGAEIGNGHQDEAAALAGLPRDNDEILGFFKSVKPPQEGKLRGQMWFTVRDRLTESVKRASIHNPRLYKCSHDAIWGERTIDRDGTEIIHRIERVNSVDLVRRGATTKSLYEEERRTMNKKDAKGEKVDATGTEQKPAPAPRTARQVLESVCRFPRDRRVLEDAGLMTDAPVSVAADADPDEQMRAAFHSAINAAMAANDKDMAMKAVKAYFKITDGGESSDKDAHPSGGTESEKPKPQPQAIGTAEGMRLLESHKVGITAARVSAIARLTECEAKEYVGELATLASERDAARSQVKALSNDEVTSGSRVTEAERRPATTGNEGDDKTAPWRAHYTSPPPSAKAPAAKPEPSKN